MDWRKIIMDSIVVAIIGLAGAVLSAAVVDAKGYKKIAGKIGSLKSDTLEGQHERIKEIMVEKTNGVEKIIAERTNGIAERQGSILNKVESIDKLLTQKETEDRFRLESMNESQKEIKIHMQGINKLADDWEKTIAENKELKARNTELEKKYLELDKQYKELLSKKRRKARDMDKEIDI